LLANGTGEPTLARIEDFGHQFAVIIQGFITPLFQSDFSWELYSVKNFQSNRVAEKLNTIGAGKECSKSCKHFANTQGESGI